MGQQLTIKSHDAYKLASELVQLTGESMTGAVTRVLREAVEQERRRQDKEVKGAELLTIAAEIKAHMQPGTTSDHSWLYDEDGLPK